MAVAIPSAKRAVSFAAPLENAAFLFAQGTLVRLNDDSFLHRQAYDQALAYSRQRNAFGKPIAEFQAIQLKLAEMATQVQAARLLTWWAASEADKGKRVDLEAGMAKYFASEVAIANSLEAMRVHGGIGYSQELDIERLYRDAPLMSIGEGTNDIMKMVIAKGLLKGQALIGG